MRSWLLSGAEWALIYGGVAVAGAGHHWPATALALAGGMLLYADGLFRWSVSE